MSTSETKVNKEVFNQYLSDIYNRETLYNKENKGLNMIWIVTLENNKTAEVVNSEIGSFISNNKVIKAELKQDGKTE